MKNPVIAEKLKECFSNQSEIDSKDIKEVLQGLLPEASTATISWRLNQLKKDKLLYQIGRGLYTFDYKPEFSPELSLKSKRLYNRVKALYNGEIVMWDTLLLNEIAGGDISKYWVFLALNKDELDALFGEMLSFSKKVYIQPDKETTARYLIPQDEAIILTALISETPTERSGDYLSPSIEGILVNAWFEHEQYLQPIGLDIHKLYEQAFAKYNVNKSKLLRYAARRDKRKEINELLKTIE
ncbi:DUF6577 family protein [Roseivirga pacifica]|uniref:DUF6577 family protein n=1 Tax=Roseivirga pacifica TaxID=1267423 RepID=UPI0020960BE1|nr:DUF6577 family protein [Roseivirga pacifica]MCO6359038.1 hypothetical protein [Roseivirga pacifica]MCO6365326.1 hypothetical protein [Roseivirga pacifica]MCO6371944.1 hypothetical protein [Roseivirga pacifica]MCO6375945.1 hypothetical protein [Roseivirga pacifica]MCO6379322.1 hypothetical protein [Roseivirga pacifica]